MTLTVGAAQEFYGQAKETASDTTQAVPQGAPWMLRITSAIHREHFAAESLCSAAYAIYIQCECLVV